MLRAAAFCTVPLPITKVKVLVGYSTNLMSCQTLVWRMCRALAHAPGLRVTLILNLDWHVSATSSAGGTHAFQSILFNSSLVFVDFQPELQRRGACTARTCVICLYPMSQRRLRVLALHSWRTSSDIFREQVLMLHVAASSMGCRTTSWQLTPWLCCLSFAAPGWMSNCRT
jgi:hypothetical protein